jgi:serine/threonine protein kinase
MIQHRIENLARLLKADYKPVELQTLDCIGIITRYLQGGDLEHGMLFKFRGGRSATLSTILEGDCESLDAGEWYQLATTFSRAVLFLHLAGWLHKGIRSDNLMFFVRDGNSFVYDKPYIVGFEYTREASSARQTEGVDDDFEFNLYRHPEVQGLPAQNSMSIPIPTPRTPFDYQHDIYSLGIVLLELGLKEAAKNIQQRASLLANM